MSVLYDFMSGPRSKFALLNPHIVVLNLISCLVVFVFVSFSLYVNFRFSSNFDCRILWISISYVSFVAKKNVVAIKIMVSVVLRIIVFKYLPLSLSKTLLGNFVYTCTCTFKFLDIFPVYLSLYHIHSLLIIPTLYIKCTYSAQFC